jgi:hypothetical protein
VQVKLRATIGWLDQQRYSLPSGQEGETIECDERAGRILVDVLQCADEVAAKREAKRPAAPVKEA